MTANIDRLMETVYRYFLDLYHPADGDPPEDIFLAFEPIGRAVDLDSYKLDPSDTDFFAAKALEEVSELTDDIPAISADIFRATDKSVQGFYSDFIVHGSTAGTDDQGEVGLFNRLKANAAQKLEDTQIGKYGRQGDIYSPTYADPEDWYNPTQTDNWKAYTYQMDQESSSSTGKPPKIKPNPSQRRWQWQVLPKEFTPVLTNPQIINRVSIKPMLQHQAVRAELDKKAPQLSTFRGLKGLKVQASSANLKMAQPLMAQPLMAKPAVSEKLVSKMVLSDVAVSQLRLTSQQPSIKQAISPIVLDDIRRQIKQPQVGGKQIANSAERAAATAVLLDNTYSRSVESSQLKISFQYCIVHLDRPWFSHSLLQTKGWYIPGFEAGEFSDGTPDSKGLFSALPISFLVVKDLEISGWQQSEYEYVSNAIALGPFSLMNRTINQAKLTCEGLQVIGWISQVMPFMPPLSDPTP